MGPMHDQSSGKRNILWLVGLIVAGFLFRVLLLRTQYAVGWDEAHYLQLGISFARGRIAQGLHPYWSPAYPVLLGLFSFVFPGYELAGRVASMVCGVLTCIPVYFLTRRIAGPVAAILASAWLCFYPPLAYQSTEVMAESMLILFSVVGVYYGWIALEKKSVIHTILASIAFSVAYLTKPEGSGYFALFIAVTFFWGVLELRKTKKLTRLYLIMVSIFVFFIFASPYLLYLHRETGRWTLSSKVFANQQLGAQEYTDPSVNYSHLSEDNTLLPLDAIYHQGNFLRLVASKKQATRDVNLSVMLKKYSENLFRTLKYQIPALFGAVLFCMFALGLFQSIWPQGKTAIQLYLLFNILGFWLVFIPMFFLVDRYFYPGLTLCFIWIGMGTEWMADWIKVMSGKLFSKTPRLGKMWERANLSLVSVLFIVSAFSMIPESAKVLAGDRWSKAVYADAVELKEAGLWLKQNTSEPLVLMSTNKGVDFYAGVEDVRLTASFTNTDFNRLLAYAQTKNVNHIVLAERYHDRFPDLMFLFDDDRIPESLELIYDQTPAQGLRVRIFKFVKAI